MRPATLHHSMRSPFGTVRMGASFDALIPTGAKVLSTDTQSGVRTTAYDTDGDGRVDLALQESLDGKGEVTERSLWATRTDAKGFLHSFRAEDKNHDGKVDFFSSQDRHGYQSYGDTNGDGKADDGMLQRFGKEGQVTGSESLRDLDFDGKVDRDYKTRAGRKSERMPATPVIAGSAVGTFGAPTAHVVPVGATKVYAQDFADHRVIGFDLNGDGSSDIWQSDWLDASGKTTSRYFAIDDPAQGGKYLGSVGDINADGVIDYVSVPNADGSTLAASDTNGDGKTDFETLTRADGSSVCDQDTNGDGAVDWVTTLGKAA